MSDLRGYQANGNALVRQAWREGARRILYVMPTGAGKTVCAVDLVVGAVRRGRRVLWCTHRRELVAQASARLARCDMPHGVVLAGCSRRADMPVQVASVQTLTVADERPADINIVCLDEGHHATAGTWRAIVTAYPALELVLGLTATPQRGDATALGDVFERLVVACTVADLQRLNAEDPTQGLVPIDVFAPASQSRALSEHPVDAYLRRLAGKRAIVFASSVSSAHDLAAEFKLRGIPAACVEGTTHVRERARAIADFAAGRVLVLVNVFCLTEGLDVPATEGIIVARLCSAWATLMQMIGRGARPSPATGKTRCTVLDLCGNVHEHGLPADERVFSLDGLAVRSVDALPPCRQCPKCLAWGRLSPCSLCGHALPAPPAPRVSARELTLIRQAAAAARGGPDFDLWCKLVRDAREKGHKPQAPVFRFRAMRGYMPRWRADQVPAASEVSA